MASVRRGLKRCDDYCQRVAVVVDSFDNVVGAVVVEIAADNEAAAAMANVDTTVGNTETMMLMKSCTENAVVVGWACNAVEDCLILFDKSDAVAADDDDDGDVVVVIADVVAPAVPGCSN